VVLAENPPLLGRAATGFFLIQKQQLVASYSF
jgi:hypothetical protein